jgi:hypothetical protein
MENLGNFDTHTPRGAGDSVFGGFEGGGIHIGHFFFGNGFELVSRKGAGNVFFNVCGSRFDFQGLFDHFGNRGKFDNKLKGAVFEYGDLSRQHLTHFVFGSGVVLGAKIHNVDAMRSESRTDWGSRIGFARLEIEFNNGFNFFGHTLSFRKNDHLPSNNDQTILKYQ